MKITKILLASIAAAISFPAITAAGDVVDPFYGPEPGHILTKTFYEQANKKFNDGNKVKSKTLQETIYYGLTDSWSLYFDGYNSWINNNALPKEYEMRYWDAGIGYFFEPTANTSVDAELYYTEKKPEDYDAYKTLYFYGRFDFMKDKDVKPFIGTEYSRGLHQITKSDDYFDFFAGVWKRFGNAMIKVSADVEYLPDYPESTNASATLEAGYQFTDNFALTVSGDYYFYDHYVNKPFGLDTGLSGRILVKYLF